jgi:hypothetical protein
VTDWWLISVYTVIREHWRCFQNVTTCKFISSCWIKSLLKREYTYHTLKSVRVGFIILSEVLAEVRAGVLIMRIRLVFYFI